MCPLVGGSTPIPRLKKETSARMTYEKGEKCGKHRVYAATTNTPAFFANPHPFYFLFLNNMMFSGVVQTNSKPDSIGFRPSAAVLAVADW